MKKGIVLLLLCLLLVLLGGFYAAFSDRPFWRLFAKTEIRPVSEWPTILVGKWNYASTTSHPDYKIKSSGEIEFDAEKRFTMYFSFTKKPTDFINVGMEEHYGGQLAGIWYIGGRRFFLVVRNCGLKNDGEYDRSDPCRKYDTLSFGDFIDARAASRTVCLSSTQMKFEDKYFANQAVERTSFKRMD